MRTTRQMSVTLPKEMADRVKEMVASGNYASESEVIRDGLRALEDRNAAVERWLRNEVAPTYDAWKADPDSVVGLEQVFDELDERLAAQGRKRGQR